MVGHLVLSGVVGALAFGVYLSAMLSAERWSVQNVLFVILMGFAAFAAITPLLAAFAVVIWRYHERVAARPFAFCFTAMFIAAGYVYGLGEMLSFELPLALVIGGAALSAIAFVLLTKVTRPNQLS
jgi:hypothetical protein